MVTYMRPYSLLLQAFILTLLFPLSSIAADTQPKSTSGTAILAGGCFWCIEADFEKLDGVLEVVSGYTGGSIKSPTYKQVSSGLSGHIEAVKVSFDPDVISYRQILDFFWRHIDPTRNDGQFCDTGPQYRPAIFYMDESQKTIAIESMDTITKIKPFKEPLKVELIPASHFYLAEQYHQDYYKKNPIRYRYYRFSCRRDARIEQLWDK